MHIYYILHVKPKEITIPPSTSQFFIFPLSHKRMPYAEILDDNNQDIGDNSQDIGDNNQEVEKKIPSSFITGDGGGGDDVTAVGKKNFPGKRYVYKNTTTSAENPFLCPEDDDSSGETSSGISEVGMLLQNTYQMGIMLLENYAFEEIAPLSKAAGLGKLSKFAGKVSSVVGYAGLLDMVDVKGYGNMVSREYLDSICRTTYEENLCRFQRDAVEMMEDFVDSDLQNLDDLGDSRTKKLISVQNAFRSFDATDRKEFFKKTNANMLYPYVAVPPVECRPAFMKPNYVQKSSSSVEKNQFEYGEPDEATCPTKYVASYREHVEMATKWIQEQTPPTEEENGGADPADLTIEIRNLFIKLGISRDVDSCIEQYKVGMILVGIVAGISMLGVLYLIYRAWNRK